VLKRADGLWAYQLAVVVDDADKASRTWCAARTWPTTRRARSLLQRALGCRTAYLHTPLVLGANGEKLSKQNGAAAIDLADPAGRLRDAAAELGLSLQARHRAAQETLAEALLQWHEKGHAHRAGS
jgi:glutamyl-Q tRNA(Asp) synthetase